MTNKRECACGYDLNDGEHGDDVNGWATQCNNCYADSYYYEPANDYAADRDWADSTWPNEY